MKPETVIKVENLSKQYRLGNVGLGSLGADVNRWWHTKILRNEDPYLKIGEENNREVIGSSEYVWALRDINFDVQQGEVLGIIGRNGAGKSTLLKILSRTTGPTTGSIKIKGRVASLLEVGTGFHPELTGRENIFLNGAILGMTKDEIRRKFDEIVAFAGVERYVDTPVKRYSSGMYVRLAFAVAAHLEPEILIVDEVLAVGDAEFQKKAIGKMKEVSEGQGRTVLFVSHNMTSIANLCTKGILLINGRIDINDSISQVIKKYQILNQISPINLSDYNRKGTGECRIKEIKIISEEGLQTTSVGLGNKIDIVINIENLVKRNIEDVRIIIGIYNTDEEGIVRFDTRAMNFSLSVAEMGCEVSCSILDHVNLKPDIYTMNVLVLSGEKTLDYVVKVSKFSIENFDFLGTGQNIQGPELSKVIYNHKWIVKNHDQAIRITE